MKIGLMGKTSDMFSLDAFTKDGEWFQFNGYVPEDLGIGGGDYFEFEVDLETGKILTWNKEAVLKFIESTKEKYNAI